MESNNKKNSIVQEFIISNGICYEKTREGLVSRGDQDVLKDALQELSTKEKLEKITKSEKNGIYMLYAKKELNQKGKVPVRVRIAEEDRGYSPDSLSIEEFMDDLKLICNTQKSLATVKKLALYAGAIAIFSSVSIGMLYAAEGEEQIQKEQNASYYSMVRENEQQEEIRRLIQDEVSEAAESQRYMVEGPLVDSPETTSYRTNK